MESFGPCCCGRFVANISRNTRTASTVIILPIAIVVSKGNSGLSAGVRPAVNLMKSCRTKYSLTYRIVGWLGLLFFVPLLFIPWTENAGVAIGIISFFILLCVICLIESNGTLEITPEIIIEHKLYGRYGIRWDEIETIRYCDVGDWVTFESMVLEGNHKRLTIPGPGDWGGAGAAESRQWFYEEVRRRGLEIKKTWSAAYKFSKNARLS